MKLIQATESITQLTWLGLFNAFLVREPDGFTLVDTMIRGNAERILGCAKGMNRPIVRIVLTHAHK
jgi:glyoxylase-like metal-dependent hydrolase (beta-lactamase superfamily II)